ncbi:MAG: flagellar basal-body rod protein FlgC [Nocardioidaceae bacterium]|nr:flagellar basal-body rod protein FlgC [Nocardioidaceae bacterium]MCL2613292.1 flagellar basal-body rod protein FlgC [Nocardioidaceae bacterium]
MGAFDTLSIANSALGADQTWIDSIAGNIANVNTVEPTSGAAFQATYVVFSPEQGGGVQVAGFAKGDAQGIEVSSPDSPLADKNGYVREPDIDMASQMGQLVMAQRGYQAQVEVTKAAQGTYDAALQIGQK